MRKPVVLEVIVTKDNPNSYAVAIDGGDYSSFFIAGRVYKVGSQGRHTVWGWETLEGQVCVGFRRRKYAVKHMILSQYAEVGMGGVEAPHHLFGGRPELPEA